MASPAENANFLIECLSKLGGDIDNELPLNILGPDTSEADLILLLENEKIRQQSGEHQLRLVALWIDGDKDARLGSSKRLLQYVNLGAIPKERFATVMNWNHAIFTCEQSRQLLLAEHKSAMQSKQTNLPVRYSPEEQLLMIVQPQARANRAILRTVKELQSPGEINYSIPYRSVFSYSLLQGKLFIIGEREENQLGHSTVEVVCLETGETAEAASMLAPRVDSAVATSSSSSSIFVFGGWHEGKYLSSCELFNAQSASWTVLPNMLTPRRGASALCVKQTSNAVLVVGGYNLNSWLNCVELLYTRQTDQPWRWRTLSPMHEWRAKPGMLLLPGCEDTQRILVAGGDRKTAELLTISCTDAKDQGQWTLLAPLSKRFYKPSLLFFNDRVLAFDCFGDVEELKNTLKEDCQEITPTSHAWTPLERLKERPEFVFSFNHGRSD